MTTTTVSTPNSSDNLTYGHVYKQLIYEHIIVPALISVNVIVITLLSIVTAVLVCYFIRKYFKTSESIVTAAITGALIVSTYAGVGKAPLEDVVPVSDNPAYQTVRIQRSDESQLKETATITIRSTGVCTSPQYENIPGDDTNNNNSCDEGDYENVE